MKVLESMKVFSLCDDFGEDESLYNRLSAETSADCYITYTANSEEKLKSEGYSNDEVANKLIELGCEEGEEVFIHIDY